MSQPTAEAGEQTQRTAQTYQDLAKLIDHTILRPELSEEDVASACRLARQYDIAAVVVRPTDVDLAARLLEGSGVALASVVSYPFGLSVTAVKLYECRDLLRRGCKEIEAPMNLSKMLSRQFQYVESEVLQLVQHCQEQGARLKIVFETPHMAEDLKIIACKIANRTGAHFAAAPGLDGLRYFRPRCKDRVEIKVASGADTLADALEVFSAGGARLGTANTAAILDEWKAVLAAQKPATEPQS